MLPHSHRSSYNTNQKSSSLSLQMTLPGSFYHNSSTSNSLVSLQSFLSQDYPPTISHRLASFLFPSSNRSGNIRESNLEKNTLHRLRIETNPEEAVSEMINLISSQSLPTQGISRDSRSQQGHSFIKNHLLEQTLQIGTYQLIIHFTTRILKSILDFQSDLNKNDGDVDENIKRLMHMAYSILTNPIFLSQKLQPEQYSDTFSLINTFFAVPLISESAIWSQYFQQQVQKEETSRPKPKALSIMTPKIIPEEKFNQATSRLNTQERYSTASNSVNNSKKNSESDPTMHTASYQQFLNEIYEGCFLGDLEMDISPFDRFFTTFEQDHPTHYKSHNIRSLRRDHQTQSAHHQFHSYSQSPPMLPRQNVKYATSPAIYPTNAPQSNPSIEIQDPKSPPLPHQKPASSSDIIELKLFTFPNFGFNPANNNNALNPMEIFSPIDYTNPNSPAFNLQSLIGAPLVTSASDIKTSQKETRHKVESSSLSPMLKKGGIQEAAPQRREIKNINLMTKRKTEATQPGSSPLLEKSSKIRLQSEILSAQKISTPNKNKVPKKVTNEEFKLWDLISVNGKIQKN